jgi:hypothetical protein
VFGRHTLRNYNLKRREMSIAIPDTGLTFNLKSQLQSAPTTTTQRHNDTMTSHPNMSPGTAAKAGADATSKTRPTKKANATWTSEEEELLVDFLIAEKNKGNASDNNFKPTVWKELERKFHTRAMDGDVEKTVKQIKSKYQNVSWLCHYQRSAG